MTKFLRNFILILSILSLQGCGIYSFTGASISPDVKTIQISNFPNYAPLVNPSLSQDFTLALQDLFLTRTNLNQVNANGDLQFEGEIKEYNQKPVAISSNPNDQTGISADKVRLTVGINVRFYNLKDEEQNFEKVFMHYEDMDGTETLNPAQEQQLLELIIERITNDIFNESVANW